MDEAKARETAIESGMPTWEACECCGRRPGPRGHRNVFRRHWSTQDRAWRVDPICSWCCDGDLSRATPEQGGYAYPKEPT